MPMTVKDAHDVNIVLRWLRGDNSRGPDGVSAEDTLLAARRLATRAYNTLGAGLAPSEVTVKVGTYPPGATGGDGDPEDISYLPRHLAQFLTDAGLTGVTVGQYGSFPVVITGIIPEGGDAGLHVFRVAESLADGRAHSTAQDRMSEPLWAGIFEPNSAGWVTSPIEAWDGLTVAQVRDKITGYL